MTMPSVIAARIARTAQPCLALMGRSGLAPAQTLVGPDIELREGALVRKILLIPTLAVPLASLRIYGDGERRSHPV